MLGIWAVPLLNAEKQFDVMVASVLSCYVTETTTRRKIVYYE